MRDAPAPDAGSADKLLAATGIKLRLALASGLILGAGALLAPRTTTTGVSTPQEHAAPLLEEQVQLREVARPFRGVQDVAARVRGHSVAIPSVDQQTAPVMNDFSEPNGRLQAAGFGVVVSDTHVLTHAGALDGRSTAQVVTADGRSLEAQVAGYEPGTGLVLLRTTPSGRPPATVASVPPDPGTLAVAVAHWDGRNVAVPVFVTSVADDQYRIGATADSMLSGMPVYNVDGELLAIAAGDGREGAAFPVREALRRLIARASRGERLASVGIAFQDLAGLLAHAFGERGVLINHVIDGGPADAAGIQAADVLLAVGGTEVDSSAMAARTLRSMAIGNAVAIRIIRAGRSLDLEVTPAPAYEVAALSRGAADGGGNGPEAGVVLPRPLLDRAGIPPTTRVISVNGRSVANRAQAQRALRGATRPVPVLLRRGADRFFAAIEPSQ